MKKHLAYIYSGFLLFGILILFTACPTPQIYPEIPEISFKNITLTDSTDLLGNRTKQVKLGFNVIDGNGDIGLLESDTTGIWGKDSEYYYNLFIKLYEIRNDSEIEVTEPAPRNFRIPYVEPQGQNKTLIADIFIDMDFTYNVDNELEYDSVLFKFYIYDRALNMSNEEKSVKIKLSNTGVFEPESIEK